MVSDIQKNVHTPIFIKGIDYYPIYIEGETNSIVPYIKYGNINQIVSVEAITDEDEKHFKIGNEEFDVAYTVLLTNGGMCITQEQFDKLMNEYSFQAF